MLSFFNSTKRGRDIFQSVGSPKTKPSVLMLGNCAWPMDRPLIDLATFVYSTGLPRYGRIWTFIFFPVKCHDFFFTKRSGKGNPFPKRSSRFPFGQRRLNLYTSIFRWWSDLCLKNTDGAEIQLNHLGNRVNSGITYLSTGSSFWPTTEGNAKSLSMYQKMFRISQESRSSPKTYRFKTRRNFIFFTFNPLLGFISMVNCFRIGIAPWDSFHHHSHPHLGRSKFSLGKSER